MQADFDELANPQNLHKHASLHNYRYDRRNDVLEHQNDIIHVDRFQSQNRMDEMELTDYNETFNKVLDYEDFKLNVLNNKV